MFITFTNCVNVFTIASCESGCGLWPMMRCAQWHQWPAQVWLRWVAAWVHSATMCHPTTYCDRRSALPHSAHCSQDLVRRHNHPPYSWLLTLQHLARQRISSLVFQKSTGPSYQSYAQFTPRCAVGKSNVNRIFRWKDIFYFCVSSGFEVLPFCQNHFTEWNQYFKSCLGSELSLAA